MNELITTPVFLTAEWRKLAIANYAVDAALLQSFLPYKTEVDTWQGKCYVSLVGFMFLNTRLKGIRIPFHSNFEEVNLRFYVRYKTQDGWKRGVVFIKELVPRPALAFVANTVYRENYETLRMAHSWKWEADQLLVEYRWRKKEWNIFSVTADATQQHIQEDSKAAFITEHYWGYTKVNDQVTKQYQVAHPRWTEYAVKNYSINVDFGNVYGAPFSFLTTETPVTVMIAEGSKIKVHAGFNL